MCHYSMDLTGMLIIKARLGDEYRRIPIHNEDITYDELLLMLQRLFPKCLSPTDDVLLKYKDEDGDLITIADGSDLMYAKAYSRTLSLTIFVKGKDIPVVDISTVRSMRSELVSLRDRINRLLDKLEDTYPEPPKPPQHTEPAEEKKPVVVAVKHDPAMTAEFDPLNSSGRAPNKQEVKPSQSAASSLSSGSSATFQMKSNGARGEYDMTKQTVSVTPSPQQHPPGPPPSSTPETPTQSVSSQQQSASSQPSPAASQPNSNPNSPHPSASVTATSVHYQNHRFGPVQVSGGTGAPNSNVPGGGMQPPTQQQPPTQHFQHYPPQHAYQYVPQPHQQQNYYGTQPPTATPPSSQGYYPQGPTAARAGNMSATGTGFPQGYPPQPYPNPGYPPSY
ncbi:hypothetical protein ACHWQZ_G005446 [Mnemiopsis leidyi]